MNAISSIVNKAKSYLSNGKAGQSSFHSIEYLRHNARRLEHLASLGLSIHGKTVLEVGAGIGDHTHFYLDRGCNVTITEARENGVAYLKKRYPNQLVLQLDLDSPSTSFNSPFEIIHCYGLLYHLSEPEIAMNFMRSQCAGMFLLETCVSAGSGLEINPIAEAKTNPTQAVSGQGCRPTREWIFSKLQKLFPFAYMPITQPNHEEFPLDWKNPTLAKSGLMRSIFIASLEKIENDQLISTVPERQRGH